MPGFPDALSFVLEREGGYSDHPEDRGGSTYKGVRQDKYDAWRRKHGKPTRDVREMTDDEISSFYREEYWVPAHCHEWWWPLSLAVFDAAVQHGPSRAVKMLQQAAGSGVDGVVGPKTRGAVAETPRDALLRNLRHARLEYYAEIVRNDESQAAFIVGWIRRMHDLERETEA